MAAATTQTAFDAMLKELYPGKTPEHTAVQKYPWLAMCPKKDDFVGDNLVCPVQYEFPMGRSADFGTAQTNAAASKMIKFVGAQKMDYGVVTIDALTIRSSKNDRGAFVEARKNEIDGMLRGLGRSAAYAAFRDGTGSLGAIASSGISTTTMTLANADDAAYFGVGGVYVADTDSDGGGTTAKDDHTVASVNEDAGTVTFTTSLAGGNAWADADTIFPDGDNTYAGTTTGTASKLKVIGLAGWLPLTAPSSGDSHFGVDRSVHVNRLSGHRLNDTSNTIEENFLKLGQKVVRTGGNPDCGFVNHDNFTTLVKSLGSKVEYQDFGGNADYGFDTITIWTAAGKIRIYADPACPTNRGYLLQKDVWTLHHLDGFPHLDTLDGNRALRGSDYDGIEVRARYWGDMFCAAPGYNGVAAI